MANIRRDEAQLIITIDAKESAEYQKVLSGTAKGVQDIKKLTVGTEEYNAALNEQAAISRKLSQSDYTKLSIKQIQDRRAQLVQLQRTLPGVTFAEAGFERELQQVNTALATNAQRTRAVSGAMRDNIKEAANWRNIYTVGIGIATGLGVAIGTITARFQKYSAVLKIALGSQQESDKAMQLVKESAAQTTFTVDELTESYVKFANRGIRLTKDEMISLADLAASQGKSFDQLTEAILDAQTGEFERLKEFGIRASKSGDEANISFKGFNATAKLTPEAIKNTFIEMGKLNGVAGANAEQMTALGGRWSNFRDVTDSILVSLGASGIGRVFGNLIGQATEYGKKLVEIINPSKTAADETRKLQNEFNNEIGVLKRLSPEAEGRRDIIQAINVKYKEYLPNLLSETASIKEIEAAQRSANKVFEEKLIFLAFEEEYKKQIDRTKEAIKQLAGAEVSRARSAQANQNLGQIGGTAGQLEAQRKINESFIGAVQKNATEQIDNNDKVVAELEGAYDKAAKRIGSTLDGIRRKFANTSDPESGASGASSGPSIEAIKKAAEAREKAKAEAEKAAQEKYAKQLKERNDLNSFLFTSQFDPAFSQKILDARLKQIEDSQNREQLFLEESYREGKISLEQYEIERMRITSANLATRIELLDAFGQQESDKRRELNTQLLQVENELVQERAAQIGDLENAQLSDLERKFANRLITEEEYNLSRLRVQLNFYDEQMRLLEENGLIETDVYKKIQDAKLQTQIDYNKQREDNEQRTQDLQMAIQRDGLGAAAELFSLGADLLGQDEKARKKHANAIKAFEVAQIAVNLASEVQGIWKNANSNPINKLIPGWGPIFAGIQTGFAIGRAGIQTAKVSAQQFYLGGKIKTLKALSGQRITEQPNIPTLPGGDNVLIAAKPGEVMMNDNQQGALKQIAGNDIFERLRIPGFYNGGVVPSLPSTTPTLRPQVLSRNPAPANNTQMNDLMMAVNAIVQATQAVPQAISSMNLKTHVVYTDIEKTKNTVDEIKRIASI